MGASATKCDCPQGPQGERGPQGPRGERGSDGTALPAYLTYKSPNNYVATNFCTIGAQLKDEKDDGYPSSYSSNAHGFAPNETPGLSVCQKLCDDAPDCKSFIFRGPYEGKDAHTCKWYTTRDLSELHGGAGWDGTLGQPYDAAICHNYFQFVKKPGANP